MGVQAESYEQRLEAIARTVPWDEASIVGNIQDYQAMLETIRDRIDGVRRWMADSGEFDCKARDGMYVTATRIVKAVNDSHKRNEVIRKSLSRQIQNHNEGIKQANEVKLSGCRLDAASERRIVESTQPLNIVVPGLGTLTGLMGVGGINLVSRLLAGKREEEAKTHYNAIITKYADTGGIVPHPIPVVDMPRNGDPGLNQNRGLAGKRDSRNTSGNGIPRSLGIAGASIGTVGAAAGVSARVASSVGTSGGDGRSGASYSMASNAPFTRVGSAVATGVGGVAAGQRQVSGHAVADRLISSDASGEASPLQRWDPNGTYRYDPATDSWVRTDGDGASVDSYSMRGVPDVAKTALGAGAIGLAASVGRGSGAASMASTAMSAGASSSAALGSMVGTGGIGGVGSFYANNPVHATITPVSSVKGMQGLAAGLQQQAGAGTASSVNGKSSPAMMSGAGTGAGGDSGKRKPRRLGYIAPAIEDDDEFEPTPLGNMAGRRRD